MRKKTTLARNASKDLIIQAFECIENKRELAKALGISRQHVENLLRGENTMSDELAKNVREFIG